MSDAVCVCARVCAEGEGGRRGVPPVHPACGPGGAEACVCRRGLAVGGGVVLGKWTPGGSLPGSAGGWCGRGCPVCGDQLCVRGLCIRTCWRIGPLCVRVCCLCVRARGPCGLSGVCACCVSACCVSVLHVCILCVRVLLLCVCVCVCVWILSPQDPGPSAGLPSKGPRSLSSAAPGREGAALQPDPSPPKATN